MSESHGKDSKIQDLPAKPLSREQGEAVKRGAEPVGGKRKPMPRPAEPVTG